MFFEIIHLRISHNWILNLVLEKFFSISKQLSPWFSKKASVLVFLQKRIYPTSFVEFFYKNILGIKMFYQNCGHTFLLYYIICICVKFHINIMRFTQFGAPQTQKIFPQKLSNRFSVLQLKLATFNFPLNYFWVNRYPVQ